jgi:hypothetical protein
VKQDALSSTFELTAVCAGNACITAGGNFQWFYVLLLTGGRVAHSNNFYKCITQPLQLPAIFRV